MYDTKVGFLCLIRSQIWMAYMSNMRPIYAFVETDFDIFYFTTDLTNCLPSAQFFFSFFEPLVPIIVDLSGLAGFTYHSVPRL